MSSLRLAPFLAVLLLAACTQDGGGAGSATMSGSFDGVAVSSDASGAEASAAATLQGDDYLDVTITLRLPRDGYGATLVISNPATVPVGQTLVVGGGDGVDATVLHEGESPRAAGGTVRFDVLDAVAGGDVAGSYDLSFAGGSLSGDFDAVVE